MSGHLILGSDDSDGHADDGDWRGVGGVASTAHVCGHVPDQLLLSSGHMIARCFIWDT